MKRYKGIITAILSIAILSSCHNRRDDEVNVERLNKRFQLTLDAIQESYDFPGATAAYILPDGSVHGFSTGLADVEAETAMTPDMRQLAGGVGKTFVAALALKLHQEGVFNLDVPIREYLDVDDKDAWFLRLPNAEDITMRHLLTHTSGIANHFTEPGFVTEAIARLDQQGPDSYFKPREMMEWALDQESPFREGKGYHYTDTGYILAGMVIEHVTGEGYFDLVEEMFLTPFHLTQTSPSDHRELALLAAGYVSPENDFQFPSKIATDGTLVFNPVTEWTSGGFISNPKDLVRWSKLLYEEDALDGTYIEELLESGYRGKDRDITYGLGVYIYESSVGEAYGHDGGFPGYNTHLLYFPRFEIAVCIQVNRSYNNDLDSFIEKLAQVVINEL
jgi:D-alanyl-D-alanine carboxypeptidase